jgi:hypothetical protein
VLTCGFAGRGRAKCAVMRCQQEAGDSLQPMGAACAFLAKMGPGQGPLPTWLKVAIVTAIGVAWVAYALLVAFGMAYRRGHRTYRPVR